MAEYDLSTALNDCIDRLSSGQSVEDCLQLYPQLAASLRPMLEAGLVARRGRVSSAEVAQAQDRVRFKLEQKQKRKQRQSVLSRPLMLLAASAAAIIIAVGGVVFAARSTLPGDALYGARRAAESAQLALSGNNPTLAAAQMQQRREDIQRLLNAHRVANVDFEGIIEQRDTTTWRISGLDTFVAADLPNTQTLAVGDDVSVTAATTSQGALIATEIDLRRAAPRLTPTIMPSVTITPTITPTVTPTSTMAPPPTRIQATPTLAGPQPTSPAVNPQPTDDKGGSKGSDDGSGDSGSGKGDSGSGKGKSGDG